MNFGSFFKQYSFWGRILGLFFGYIMAGPIGALFGLLIGNVFDRGLSRHYNRPYWEVYIQGASQTKTCFLQTTFLFLGYLAKSDGRVTERAIRHAEQLIHDLRLSAKQAHQARTSFHQGRDHAFHFTDALLTFKQTVQPHSPLMMTFLNILYQATKEDGITLKKIKTLNQIFQTLGFAPMEQQQRFYHDASFDDTTAQYRPTPIAPSLQTAFTVLGLQPSAEHTAVKQAYRRLIGKNHPDKLIAQGGSQAEIKAANEKTQQIRKAYEVICAAKGWS